MYRTPPSASKKIDDVTPLQEIIGQDRALQALALGLDIKHNGYNVFVTGLSGTGRTTTIRRLLKEIEKRPAELDGQVLRPQLP